MNAAAEPRADALCRSGLLRALWARHRAALLAVAIAVMAAMSASRMWKAFATLARGEFPGDVPAIFHDLVPRWFAGARVYENSTFAVHPPATYAILWPVYGTLDLEPARWLWIGLLVAALLSLVYFAVRGSGASAPSERLFIALVPLSMYGAFFTIRAGQFTVLLLPLLVGALLLLQDRPASWKRDLIAAALLLPALVKPTVAAPFFWIALFLPGGLRPALLTALGYAALTALALAFQPDDFLTLFRSWQESSSELAAEGTANLHRWLAVVGLERWLLAVSLVVLVALGGWVYRNRGADLWLLLGVTAIVARFWTYHRQYDDLLLVLAAIALFRLAKRGDSKGQADVGAAALLGLFVATSLIPARLLTAPGWHGWIAGAMALFWLVTLIFLGRQVSAAKI